MIVTATEMANKARQILDAAERGLETEITRHGQIVAALVPRPRVSAQRAQDALSQNPFSAEEREALRAACREANQAFA
ncbi:MAG TPA: hypothetical protein PLT00_04745 [Verrucomicrobiota bacterium]|jgi:antitoxin (DNA-binding transcriptional repressor) of toxin-antitoxin stability system|nr:hypothetical protein [Verrucomicrobiota bacterium]OQB91502.1 MAG: hypothetical protein BWX84_01347 [Verrucomicrobia bacterium ADurb.Bin118]HPY29423.1 hypothetical protein [Verrucomicrobiota bacterium]HQB16005.1 hypothetical protein [Verrucomicrobiota bacterium]